MNEWLQAYTQQQQRVCIPSHSCQCIDKGADAPIGL